jgi:hypothetical protein
MGTVPTMSESEIENGEEAIDESGRNPTQQRIDEEGAEAVPVDVEWKESDETGVGSTEPAGSEAPASPGLERK